MKLLIITSILFSAIRVNGQQFWLTTYSFPGGPKICLTMPSDSFMLVGTPEGIVRSFDQGVHFDTLLQDKFIHSLYTTSEGMICAGGDGVIYISFSDGDTWDSIPTFFPFPVTGFVENSVGDLFATTGKLDSTGFSGAGVLYSPNGGNSWHQRATGLNGNLSCDAIAIDKNNRIYLGVADDQQNGTAGLFYSDNNGVQWHQVQVSFDGQGAVADDLRIYRISGISISPQDSIYISMDGAADNAGVNLNLYKSINDVLDASHWKRIDIAGNVTWWNDFQLNDIHFAQNGDWYSSTRGSILTGATYYSRDKGKSWERHDEGLGLNVFGGRSPQFFAEISTGRVFMIQHFAELIHYTDKSLLMTSVGDADPQPRCSLYPNPVYCGEQVQLVFATPMTGHVTIYDICGRIVSTQGISGQHATFTAPHASGMYLLVREMGNTRLTQKCIVHE